MPKSIYTVQLDGMEYDIEGDREPTERDVRGLIGKPTAPIETRKPYFSLATDLSGQQETITPMDIVTGTMPMKGVNILSENVKKFGKKAVSPLLEKLSNEPLMKKESLPIPTSVSDIGMRAGAQVTPRQIGDVASDILLDPRTYMVGGMGKGSQKAVSAAEEAMTPIEASLNATGSTIGQKGLSVFKQGKSYLYNKVAKPISEMITKNIKTSPDIAKNLGLKDETIQLLKTHGYDKVVDTKLADELASQAFSDAMGKKANVYGDKINISDTLDLLQKKFNAIKKVDPNNPIKTIINNIKGMRPAPKGFFEGMPGGLSEEQAALKGKKILTSTQNRRIVAGEKPEDIAREIRITREQFSNIRQQIDNLYKARVINKGDVLDIVDSLYGNAEKSGLTGIQNARELYHQARQFEDVATNLSKIEKLDYAKVHSELQSVVNDPTKYQVMIDKYSKYVGKDTAKKMFDEALAVRRGGKIIKRSGIGSGTGLAGIGLLDIFK